MKRLFSGIGLCICLLFLGSASAFAYDVAGRWEMEGSGYGDKKSVRAELKLEGYLDIHTALYNGRNCVTGFDLKIRIDTTRFNIKTWEKYSSEELLIPVPLPELRPTLNEPFKLPRVKTKDGLIYEVSLESVTAGVVKVYGTIDLDVLGDTEIRSNSVIWKQGTERPDKYENMLSGCQTGAGALESVLLLVPVLFFALRRKAG